MRHYIPRDKIGALLGLTSLAFCCVMAPVIDWRSPTGFVAGFCMSFIAVNTWLLSMRIEFLRDRLDAAETVSQTIDHPESPTGS